MPIIIDPQYCPQNYHCPVIKLCPKNALSQKRFMLPLLDERKCILCNVCINECLHGAIRYVE